MDTTVSVRFASNVRRIRKARGWSLRELSEEMQRLGFRSFDHTAISRIERHADPDASEGNKQLRRRISIDEAFGFAQALGVDAYDMLTGDATPDVNIEFAKDR